MAERTKAKRQAAPAAETNTGDAPTTAATSTTATDVPAGDAAGGRTGADRPARSGKSGGAKAGSAKAGTGTSRTGTGKVATKKAAAKQPSTERTPAKPKGTRSAAETERIRAALAERLGELREEYDLHLAEIAELQRGRLTDSAGDDQADTGSKAFEREQELSLAHSILERTAQVERALERLDEGHYGWCERCGDAIPVERLAAFPSATLCVRCKQLEERR